MKRLDWYATALKNLGVAALARRQLQKRLSSAGKPLHLTSKYLMHPVYARHGTSDLLVFDQIFVERQYSCLDHLHDPKLIIDCGANVGYSSAYFLSRFPKAALIAVEPDPGNFSMLAVNTKPYGDRCKAIEAAVWSSVTSVRLHRMEQAAGEWGVSVVPSQGARTDLVPTVTVPSLLESNVQSRISILKIDIEGAELELFRRPPDWLTLVDNLVIELHGPECEAAFSAAARDIPFSVSRCGELTVCLRK
jgi:FkbM family methyltransferase